MKRGQGIIWLIRPRGKRGPTIIIRGRSTLSFFKSMGYDIEGPYVPGREHNPNSPRAIRDRLNGFRKD